MCYKSKNPIIWFCVNMLKCFRYDECVEHQKKLILEHIKSK